MIQEQDLKQQPDNGPSLKHPGSEAPLHQRQRYERSDNDPQPRCSFQINRKQQANDYSKVNDRLEVFIRYFVKEFEAKSHAYHLILEGEVKKAGKFSDAFSGRMGQLVGGSMGGVGGAVSGFLLGSPVSGAKLGAKLGAQLGAKAGEKGGNILGSKVGEKQHKKKITNLLDLVEHSQKFKADFREALVKAGFDVFQSFEMQFTRVTTDLGPTRAIQQLAKDATNRAINYITKKEVTSISEGVILGESKKEGILSTKPGLEIKYEHGSNKKVSWNTAKLYRKVGLLVTQENVPSLCKRKSGSNTGKYGYRRLLMSESWEILKKEYVLDNAVESKSVEFTDYNYILDKRDLEQKVGEILNKIKQDDKNLEEKRIREILKEVTSDMITDINSLKEQSHDYVEDYKVLVNIEDNLKKIEVDKYLNKFKQDFEEIKQGQQIIAESIEIGLEENRENFNQLNSKQDSYHDEIVQSINELKVIKTVTKERIDNKNSIWFEAKKPVNLFTGRGQELNDLHNKLQHSSEKITVISQMTSISGLGGIGKTELARQYIHTHSQDYDNNVIWVNSESEVTLIESFRRLAQDKLKISTKNADGNEKDIKSIVGEVYRFFASTKIILIFDNAERSDILKKFLPLDSLSPNDNNPYVLITSREGRQLWEQWGIENGITLGIFTPEEAISFVKKSFKIDSEDKSQDDKINELAVTTLQGFPLALQQAVSHIIASEKLEHKKNRKYTIDDYLKEYEGKKKDLLDSKAFHSIVNDYTKTTFTTWKITIDKIKENEESGQRALEILEVIAYFAPNNIPVEISFSKLEKDNEKLWKAVELLDQYSMIKLEQGKLDIHRLVQEVTRLSLKEQKKEEKILEKVLELIKINSKISSDHAASAWNYASKYNILINKFLKSTYGHSLDTSLHLLAENGNYEATKAILKINGSIINTEDNYGRTALYRAAEKGYIEIVKLLVKDGADIHVNNASASSWGASRWTVLHGAVYRGNADVVQFLINKGASIYAKDSMDREPLYIAINEGHEEIIKLLAHSDEMKLFAAASLGKLEKVKDLLEDKSEEEKIRMTNPTQQRKRGPLHVAANNGYIKIVKLLVENGADINNSADDGYTPLHMAASEDHYGVVEFFVEYVIENNNKFDILEVSDKSGWTVLHSAAKSGCTKILEYLIKKFKKNKSVDAADKKGTTLLQTAAFHNNLDTVKFLISKNADINAVDIFGATPLFAASIQNNLDVVKYLLKQKKIRINCDLEKVLGMLNITPLHAAAVYDNLDMTELFVTRSSVNAGKESSLTPLHIAAFFDSSKVIKYLVDNGACTDSEVNFSNVARVLNCLKEDLNEGYGSEFINYIAKPLNLFLKIPLVGSFVSSQFTPRMISTVLNHENQLVHRDVDGKLVCSMVISRLISLLLLVPQIKKQFEMIEDYVQTKKDGKQIPPIGEDSIFHGITNMKQY